MRLNLRAGGVDVLEVHETAWRTHPCGDDLAAASITLRSEWDVGAVRLPDLALLDRGIRELNVGVGDDVFMLGRFVSHSGNQKNHPLARFGNLAMMPSEDIRDARGLMVEAYLVEMRSLSGFSGSPVFLYVGPGSYRGNGSMTNFFTEQIALLGIDAGHVEMHAPVFRGTDRTEFTTQLNTGVAIVVPVWKLVELLDEPEFRQAREFR